MEQSRKKLITNLANVEFVEYLILEDRRVNLRLTTISGKEVNNYYDNVELAEQHYQDFKKSIKACLESLG